jgi:hypothetical protein
VGKRIIDEMNDMGRAKDVAYRPTSFIAGLTKNIDGEHQSRRPARGVPFHFGEQIRITRRINYDRLMACLRKRRREAIDKDAQQIVG